MFGLYKTTKWETIKIFSKWRSYIGFITIVIFGPLIMYLVRKYGWAIEQDLGGRMPEGIEYLGNIANGLLITYFLMNLLWIHFPFFIMLVAGDIVASEGSAGTFRILMTRPVSRFQIITGKFIATFIYTLTIVLFLGLVSLGAGILIVGGGDLVVAKKEGIFIFTQDEALIRFAIAFCLAAFAQMTIGALTFMFSCWTSNSVGPIIGGYAVVFVMYILLILKIDALNVIKPYLFVTYFDVFFAPFSDPIPWDKILHQLIKIMIYIGCFYMISLVSFARKDIKS